MLWDVVLECGVSRVWLFSCKCFWVVVVSGWVGFGWSVGVLGVLF